jgi:ribosomal protein S6--L-glutamate ligase
MRLVEAADAEEEVRLFRAEGNPMIYVQKLLPGIEKDLGLAFLGGEYLGAYARVRGKDAWNTTICAGGRYAPVEPSAATLDVARRAQALFDLEFTTVDVVETHGGPLVFEVSAFGGFRGIQQGLGMDAAALYADHVLRRIAALRRQS